MMGENHSEKYPFRLAGKRRNALAKKPPWDVYWPGAISAAIQELDADHFNENSGVKLQTKDVLDAVKKRAEEIWKAKIDAAKS